MENWKPVEGYEGIYEVSDQGRVRNIKYGGRLLSCVRVAHGYLAVHLYKNGCKKMHLVHRLVAMAFIPNPKNKPQVNHIDGVKQHNHISNLEWVTSQENLTHAERMDLKPSYPTKLKKDPQSAPNYTADLWCSNLKSIRESKGLTQEELAEVSCVHLDTIKRLESTPLGFRTATVNTVCKLAHALAVNIELLFSYDVAEAIRKEKAWHKK